jgi:hypothetical protein
MFAVRFARLLRTIGRGRESVYPEGWLSSFREFWVWESACLLWL